MNVWKDGTNKFYNDAKSMVSNHSVNGASSVMSDISRSRSGSKDFMMFKPKSPGISYYKNKLEPIT